MHRKFTFFILGFILLAAIWGGVTKAYSADAVNSIEADLRPEADFKFCENLPLQPEVAFAYRDCLTDDDAERLQGLYEKLVAFKTAFADRNCEGLFHILNADAQSLEKNDPLIAAHFFYEGICLAADKGHAVNIWGRVADAGLLEDRWEAYARLSAHYDSVGDDKKALYHARRAWIYAGLAYSNGDVIHFGFPVHGFSNASQTIWGMTRSEQFLKLAPMLTGPWEMGPSLLELLPNFKALGQPSADPLIQLSKSLGRDKNDAVNIWFSAYYMLLAVEGWFSNEATFEYGMMHFDPIYYEGWFKHDINIKNVKNGIEAQKGVLACIGYRYIADAAVEGYHPAIAYLRDVLLSRIGESENEEDWQRSYNNLLLLAGEKAFPLSAEEQMHLEKLETSDGSRGLTLPSDLLYFYDDPKKGCFTN